MDAARFDRLAKALSTGGTRRRLLALVAALPVAGSLTAFLAEATEAKRSQRRATHKQGQGSRKDKGKKACKLESRAQTCRGKCGIVRGNCKGPIDCGPCKCKPKCIICQTCDKKTGKCEPAYRGETCRAATCANGTATPRGTCRHGACQPGTPQSCDPYTCDGNACATTCQDNDDCVGSAFCNGSNECVDDKPDGEPCQQDAQCQSGHCVDGVCCENACTDECRACNVTGHAGTCTTVDDGITCGTCHTCQNGNCDPVADGTACGAGGDDNFCCTNGLCPEPSGCLSGGSPCGPTSQDCLNQCCSQFAEGNPGSFTCQRNIFGPCESDQDCQTDGGAECRCGTCCVRSGFAGGCGNPFGPDPSACCSGACNGNVCS